MAAGSPTLEAFDWVDDYFAHVRPHFEVREEDRLLIVLPNQAVKLNPSGLAILRFLKDGGAIRAVARPDRARARAQAASCFYFLCDFRSLMTGCLGEGREPQGRRAGLHIVSRSTRCRSCLRSPSRTAATSAAGSAMRPAAARDRPACRRQGSCQRGR